MKEEITLSHREKKSGRQQDRFELLYQVSDAMISTLEPGQVLDMILKQAVEILNATSGSLILLDSLEPNILTIAVSHNLDLEIVKKTRLKLGQGVTGKVALTGQPLVAPDVHREKNYIEINARVRSEVAVPLKLADQVIGVINLDSERPGAFSEEDLEILVPLANHAAKVIQNAQLFDSTRQSAEALKLLQSTSRSIAASLDLGEVFQRIVKGAVQLLQARVGSLFLLDQDQQTLRLSSTYGDQIKYRPSPSLDVHNSLLGRVIQERKPLTVREIWNEPRFQQKEQAHAEGLHSLLAVPLLLGGDAIGVLAVYFGKERVIQPREIEMLSALGDQSATAIHNARMHERVVQMEEQVHQMDKLSAVGETAAGLAHEIRNPLAVMNMLISAIESDLPEEDSCRQDARVIRENIEHIHGLVEGLLDVVRIRPEEPKPCDLRHIIQNTLNLLMLKLNRQQIRVRRYFREGTPMVMADPGRIQQVLFNLIQNSMDAIGSRGEIILSLKSHPDEPGVLLEVLDNGPGISAEAFKKLFNPFYTTKEQGVGLGLSIVKRIVEEHRGTIQVESSAQKGTKFIIFLPASGKRKEPGR